MQAIQEITVLYTYRHLTGAAQRRVDLGLTSRVLVEKNAYLQTLTYQQKIALTMERLATVVQGRFRKRGRKLTKVQILSILKAEERYYKAMAQEDWPE
jgi:hypothetical protein